MKIPEPTVFVIDDDAVSCDAISWLLQSVNLNVKTFANGQIYLNEYNPKAHGCLVVDIRMPVMGGFELLEELNKRHNHLPIIFMTGHGDVPMAVRALQEGAVDFVLKPVNDQILLEKIQKAIATDRKWLEAAKDLLVPERIAALTPRELEVWQYITEGKLNKQIAADLNISSATVEFHRANLMRKLKVKTVAQLVKSYFFYTLSAKNIRHES